jgi:2,4-dienoyl-CoA reductase-like NADH-dependent reductase (Old Yellow Enzyme family)
MAKKDIETILDQFRRRTQNIFKLGFDEIELCKIKGYIIVDIIKDSLNKRTDEFGGSVENRYRLLLICQLANNI